MISTIEKANLRIKLNKLNKLNNIHKYINTNCPGEYCPNDRCITFIQRGDFITKGNNDYICVACIYYCGYNSICLKKDVNLVTLKLECKDCNTD